MKKVRNLIFMPNVGTDNFYPSNQTMIEERFSAQDKADHPTVSSLDYVSMRHSTDGMVPINNKPKR